MRLADPWWLLLLLPVAALGVLLWVRARRPEGMPFPEQQGLDRAIPPARFGPDEILGALIILGLGLAVVALSRPQLGLRTEQITGKGVDIVLCLDTSGSMRSVDFKPQNRLGAAKETAMKFIQNRKQDRLGLVVFGGTSLTVCPLTSDKKALLEFMRHVRIDMTGVDGTAIGMALATAADRLRESQAASKVIILLTDGRNNMGEINPLTAAKAVAALGIKVYAIGAGSAQGGLMPYPDPLFGTRYVRTRDTLDENMLRRVAGATGGLYFRAKDVRGLETVFSRISDLEKSEYKIVAFTNYRDLYFGWLAAAWGLLALAGMLRLTIFRRLP